MPPTEPPSRVDGSSIDYAALEAEIEQTISTGSVALDNVQAVLVNVDGESQIVHYRHGATADTYGHMWSVTKSVVSILVGIAIADGLIPDLDTPLASLLPEHRQAMTEDAAKVTLRQLLTMSGGFPRDLPGGFTWADAAKPGANYVDVLLKGHRYEPGTYFLYSNVSAHLVSAVLAAALERVDGGPQTVLDYARQKLFDPLGISTSPAFSAPLPDWFATDFAAAGFGWGTDPNGIPLGGFGLRLTAPDMMKIGELLRQNGIWRGQQIVPVDWVRQAMSPMTRITTIDTPFSDEYGLLWWIITKPTKAGYYAAGSGGQRIIVLRKSRAVITYLAQVQPDLEIGSTDVDSLDRVIRSALER